MARYRGDTERRKQFRATKAFSLAQAFTQLGNLKFSLAQAFTPAERKKKPSSFPSSPFRGSAVTDDP